MNAEELRGLDRKGLVEVLTKITESPFYNGYLAVYTTIMNLNSELMEGAATIRPDMKPGAEEGEYFDAAEKAFERSHKYITELHIYYDQLEFFRSKMLPEQVKQAESEAISLLDEARLKMRDKKKIEHPTDDF